MGFRTVIVRSRVKLELRLNYLVVRGEIEQKIYLDEIATLIVESTAVALTAALLAELARRKINVVFCDDKHNPCAELTPFYGAHNTPKRYKEQIAWTRQAKDYVWGELIRAKIAGQAAVLEELGFAAEGAMLRRYRAEVQAGDPANREGHAAKVYFNRWLGERSRRQGGFVNACLNYGYAVLLSAFNREVVASGYLTQLGMRHDNDCNAFNLSCDLVEPFRVVVDRRVMTLKAEQGDFRSRLADVINLKAEWEGRQTTLDVAIRGYVRNVTEVLREGGGAIGIPIVAHDKIGELSLYEIDGTV